MKRKLLSILALLCLTVSGAWAQTYDAEVSINTYGDNVVVPANQHWLIEGTGVETNYRIGIGKGATVTLSNVNISNDYDCCYCDGDATIILADGTTNTLTGTSDAAGIRNYEGYTLTIKGSTGKLIATGCNAAGIGSSALGNSSDCGNIVIQGGIITATGDANAAGIGACNYGKCGSITICGGTVTATGGSAAAGIGAGNSTYNDASCGNITISGGTVIATGGTNAAGIGGGQGMTGTSSIGNCGDITISGGRVSAKGTGAAACIGTGRFSTCGGITITDGIISVTMANPSRGRFIGKGASGTSGTVTIDGVPDATKESTFTHFDSESSNSTWTLTHNRYDVTANLVDGAYWSTFYSETGNHLAPEGTQVFAVNLTGSAITMTEIGDRIVNSGEGVVLKKTGSGDATTTIEMTLTEDASTVDFSANSLQGTATSITNPGNAYVLNYKAETGVGFYKLISGANIGANKAYLTYDGVIGGAREFFLFSDALGIGATLNDNVEMINDNVYDLQGRRVSQPAKGLYIVNGKKYIKK